MFCTNCGKEIPENVIATFGNSYFKSLVVSGNFKKYAYILTDKRLYYKGVGYYNVADAKMVTKVGEEFIVDLQNISCSGFVYTVSRHTFLYYYIFRKDPSRCILLGKLQRR